MYELVAIIIGSLGVGGILKGTGMLDVLISSMGKIPEEHPQSDRRHRHCQLHHHRHGRNLLFLHDVRGHPDASAV